MPAPDRRPVAAAGVICLRDGPDGVEVLLIRRGKPPRRGDWSLPGGRIEFGERAADAALRELREETGVVARLLGLIDVVDGLCGDEATHYVLIDYAAEWLTGEPVAGDDAVDARFWPLTDALSLVSWNETRRVMSAAVEARQENFSRRPPFG